MMMRKLASLAFLAFGLCAIAMGGNAAFGAASEIERPKVSQKKIERSIKLPKVSPIRFPAEKFCGDSNHSSIAAGGGLVLGTVGGVAAGAGKGAKIGIACDAVTAGTTLGLCTIAGATIGSVVGGIIGAVGGTVVADLFWNKIFGHHNCAASIYTYRTRDGKKDIWRVWNAESIDAAKDGALRHIKKDGGSEAKELVSFDAWETRCAAFAWGKDGYAYSGLGPSDTKARLALKATCKEAGVRCPKPESLCNSWVFFDWHNWTR